MLTITAAGKEGLEQLFVESGKKILHIYLASAKCVDPYLGLKVRDPYPSDMLIEQEGFTFSIDPMLFQRAKAITIDCQDGNIQVLSAVRYGLSSCARCGGCRKKEGYS